MLLKLAIRAIVAGGLAVLAMGAANAASSGTAGSEALAAASSGQSDFIYKVQSRGRIKVYYRNRCNRKIQAALRYLDPRRGWRTAGWYVLQPGERGFLQYTNNRVIYTYAESIGPVSSRLYWEGNDRAYRIRGSSRTYGFTEFRINQGVKEYTHNFTCN